MRLEKLEQESRRRARRCRCRLCRRLRGHGWYSWQRALQMVVGGREGRMLCKIGRESFVCLAMFSPGRLDVETIPNLFPIIQHHSTGSRSTRTPFMKLLIVIEVSTLVGVCS